VADLAARLRQLREEAGRPSYRLLARSAYYSHSALSQAAAGRVLPSLAVTLAFVQACGGDRQEWIARWHQAAAEAGLPTEPDGDAASAVPPTDITPAIGVSPAAGTGAAVGAGLAGPARHGLGGLLAQVRQGWRLLATAGLASLAGILAWWGLSVGLTSPGGLKPPAIEGGPRAAGYCTSSWVILDGRQVVDDNGKAAGKLVLRYSTRCETAWARFISASRLSATKGVTIIVGVTRHPDGMTQRSRSPYASNVLSQEIPLPHGDCALASVTIASPGQAPAHAVTASQPAP
jgi:hypothetical protein